MDVMECGIGGGLTGCFGIGVFLEELHTDPSLVSWPLINDRR